MKKKIFTILFALVASVGLTWATTVTWNNSTLSSIDMHEGDSFTEGGVTLTVLDGKIDEDSEWKGYSNDALKFSTSLGNFTRIEITATINRLGGSGWTETSPGAVWTGDANETTFSGNFEDVSQIVFTIEEPTVDVTGVTLSQSEAAMIVGGDALTLTATVAPDNATDKTVTWTSSDPTVATVADGVVTAVAAGTATITATATNGTDDTADDKTATCTITVTDPDQEAADAVLALFDALPAVENITLDNKEAIEAARAAYDALTDEQKALVSAEDLAKLTDAEAALAAAEKAAADQEAANAVVALFDALPAADAVTLDDKTAIEAARAAYEALTDDQKALIAPEDLAKLTIAEEALHALIIEGIEDVQGEKVQSTKILRGGHIYIIRPEGKVYNVQGVRVIL